MVTEYFIPNAFLVSIKRKEKRLAFNYFVNFLDGWNTAAFPRTLEHLFNFVIGKMTGSDFKDEGCPFRRNIFARSPAEMVSAKPGSAPT
jgi:hypothetical protein